MVRYVMGPTLGSEQGGAVRDRGAKGYRIACIEAMAGHTLEDVAGRMARNWAAISETARKSVANFYAEHGGRHVLGTVMEAVPVDAEAAPGVPVWECTGRWWLVLPDGSTEALHAEEQP